MYSFLDIQFQINNKASNLLYDIIYNSIDQFLKL